MADSAKKNGGGNRYRGCGRTVDCCPLDMFTHVPTGITREQSVLHHLAPTQYYTPVNSSRGLAAGGSRYAKTHAEEEVL